MPGIKLSNYFPNLSQSAWEVNASAFSDSFNLVLNTYEDKFVDIQIQ